MHLYNSEQILNHSIFKTKKAFQNHAHEPTLDIPAIGQCADLCLVSA